MDSRRSLRSTCRNKGKSPLELLFLLPSLAGVAIFVLIPFGDVIRRSFVTAIGGKFTGVRNYQAVLTNQMFLMAAGNTLRFMAMCVPLLAALSLAVALLLYALPGASGVFRATFLLPMAIPAASVAMLWQALFHKSGLVNGWLAALNMAPQDWMGSPKAFWVLAGTFLWKNIGYDIVLWLAGLGAIPTSMQEAARVDGAGPLAVFWHVTLPNLLPSLYTVAVLSLLGAFKVFREAYLVAGDYPDTSIYLLQHLFNNWFRELSMDKLAAGAVLVALAVLAMVLLLRAFWEAD